MAIRDDLLYQENILTQSELEQIINPFSKDILEKYGSDIGLSGYPEIVKEFINKINSYIEYGNLDINNKNYKKVVEEQKIVRYRKKVTDTEYVDCLADSDGAEPYEYTFTTIKYVQDNNGENIYTSEIEDTTVPPEFNSLKKCNISELINNIEKIKFLLYNEKVITKKVAVSLLDDIIAGIETAQEENEKQYLNKQYFNKDVQSKNLPLIKQNYISYYNEYEDLLARQSLFIKKAKHTDGKELDIGL